MGCGLSIDLAARGHKVRLVDSSGTALDRARLRLDEDLRILRFAQSEFRSIVRDDVMNAISFCDSLEGFENVDWVVENVTEDYATKRPIYVELGERLRPDVIIGVNTSCLSITRMGGLVPAPGRVIGTHFMNPVPMKKMVEVIRGFHTSEDTVARTERFLQAIGKEGIVVNDLPGFVTNRVMMLMINECAFVVQDGVADAETVDRIFRMGFGHKMGPLATADLIGLDTILHSIEVLHESYADSKYRPCPLLRKMVDAELLGRKSGQGFFSYSKTS